MNGSISYDAKLKKWRIDAPPHLILKLKRVFPRISRKAHGEILIADTEETCRDLEWFMGRHPMGLAEVDAQRLHDRAAAHKDRQSLVDAMLARKLPPPVFDLALPPREYQRIAGGLCLQSGGLLLADDVGVGKTVSSICVLADPRATPALVVTLTHLPRQWERELARFAPKLRVHIIKKGTPYDLTEKPRRRRADAQLDLPGALPDVIIINYHKLHGWAETLAPLVSGHAVVFDEVQELRHPDSKRYAAAKHIADGAAFRLGCSATPIHNYGDEFFSVLDVLRPNFLGTREEFLQEWCKEGGKSTIEDPVAFGSYLRSSGLMLRRTRSDVGRELPKLSKVIHHVDSDPEALNAVSASCAELARIILERSEEGADRGQKMMAAAEFNNQLRQATGIAKAPYVADFVKMLVESGESVLLYGWHRAVYDIWLDKLKEFNPAMYTGSESAVAKEEARRRFIEGKTKVLIMSLRAGAGLDGLQHVCRTTVHGELDWSPAVGEQNIGRVHRDGQKDPVVAYFLVAEDGVDPIIVDILGLKREQLEGVRDGDAELIENLEVDGDRIKRLAEAYLASRGLPVPQPIQETAA